ncbi:hypothetical protein Ccrd_020236 [Cynara cardunculus var. scolymus]|uniref:Uncharacterized protein n=1 Tax=Cynara cardunculus var. scolymus TaxID=59895 RepID=A0A103Y2T4_CYNCS|nr:hypothetical protein Ccrd_020236 [Cynara cardunculus var. scolymus]
MLIVFPLFSECGIFAGGWLSRNWQRLYPSVLNNINLLLVKENLGPVSGGLAPIYGAAGKIPDKGLVNELLVYFMDNAC